MNTEKATPEIISGKTRSALSPFRHATFTVLWTATIVSNIGSWMYSAASGWLMTSLNSDPLIVSLVRSRRPCRYSCLRFRPERWRTWSIGDGCCSWRRLAPTAVSTIFACLVWLNAVTPASLLIFAFLAGVGGALTAPAWQSTVPQLVPKKEDLQPAVVLNGVEDHISRAIRPGLRGLITASLGLAAPPLDQPSQQSRGYGRLAVVAATTQAAGLLARRAI